MLKVKFHEIYLISISMLSFITAGFPHFFCNKWIGAVGVISGGCKEKLAHLKHIPQRGSHIIRIFLTTKAHKIDLFKIVLKQKDLVFLNRAL